MNQHATTIGTWAHAIVRALESYQLDGLSLCRSFDIDTARLTDPHYRIPVTTMTPLWRKCVEVTGDSAFGLRVAEHVSPTTFHALGFAAMASRNFQEVAAKVIGNTSVISEVAQGSMVIKGTDLWFSITIKPNSPEVSHEALDAFLGALVYMGRKFVGVDMPFTAIYLQRPEPEDRAVFDEFFKVPLYFSQEENAMVCPVSALMTLMPSYNPALVEANEKVLREYSALQSQSLPNQIKNIIEDLLPEEPLQSYVAKKLNMSVRKMQRSLEAEGKNYQSVLDEVRKSKALLLLEEGRLNLKVIAHQLGFANQSAFTRAFKRWTGQTPLQMLKKKT